MNCPNKVLEVTEDLSINRYQIPHRLTSVMRRLMKYFSKEQKLITCIGNIGAGKSSLTKILAYTTGMNALFELPDEGFEDHLVQNETFFPMLGTMKDSAKRTLGIYYGAISEFIEAQANEEIESPRWMMAKRNVEKGALDIQHAYLDLRKMQLQTVPLLGNSTCIDGSAFADRYAFSEVLHNDMDVEYLTRESLNIIDKRLESEFRHLVKPDLMILLHAPLNYLFLNVKGREREEEQGASYESETGLPEGLARLIRALNNKYETFLDTLYETNWYRGPVLKIDVSKIDFVSNVQHLIAVYEGIEKLLIADNGE